MKIEYFGHSCFRLTSDSGVSVITDPYTRVGYELPKPLTADIVTVSHEHFDHNYVSAIGGAPAVIDKAGVYSVCGLEIVGKDSWHDQKCGSLRGNNVIFKITVDGVTFCHFGDIGEEYSKAVTEKISGADVWLIPVGGTYTIDGAQAKEYVKKLSPKAVIPMHYRPADGTLDISSASPFLSGTEEKEIVVCKDGTLTLTKNGLYEGKTKIIYMERQKGK